MDKPDGEEGGFGNEIELTLLEGVAEFWNSKAFADLDVVCGVDGRGIFALITQKSKWLLSLKWL